MFLWKQNYGFPNKQSGRDGRLYVFVIVWRAELASNKIVANGLRVRETLRDFDTWKIRAFSSIKGTAESENFRNKSRAFRWISIRRDPSDPTRCDRPGGRPCRRSLERRVESAYTPRNHRNCLTRNCYCYYAVLAVRIRFTISDGKYELRLAECRFGKSLVGTALLFPQQTYSGDIELTTY